jgi:hypothetical protein
MLTALGSIAKDGFDLLSVALPQVYKKLRF